LAPGWIIVRNGLLLVRISTIIMLFVALGMVLFTALALGIVPMLERNRQAEMFLGILSIMSGLVFLGGAIMALVGQCMCCAVPDSGPKGLAISSVICLVLSLLLGAGAALLIVVQDQQRPFGRPTNLGPVIAALYFLAMALGVVSHALFGFFLKGVANFFEKQGLSKSVGVYLILFAAFVASFLMALMLVILIEASRHDRDTTRAVTVVLGVVLLIFAIVLVLWFLDVLGRVRSSITKALQEGW
jgi:hypothetical protein